LDGLWKWGNTITISTDKEYVGFSKIRCFTSKFTSGMFSGLEIYEPADSSECKKFLKNFITLFNELLSGGTCSLVKAKSKIIWVSHIESEIAEYVNSPANYLRRGIRGNELLRKVALIMDNSTIPINNEILSLKIGPLRHLIERKDNQDSASYQLEFYQ
jgi:hypothetical protein